MSHEFDEDQLVHYFAGECSEKEAAEIEAWINADSDRERRVARLRHIWEAADSQPAERSDVDAMWENLIRRLGPSRPKKEEPDSARRADRSPRRKREGRIAKKLASRVLATAASVVVFALAAWALFGGQVFDRGASSMRTITTEVGQRAQIKLGDGTQVTLNAESALTLPPEFGDKRRSVSLRGQAYFEVEPDAERPFLVHAGGSVTRVLGTKFDVGAYPEDKAVRIVVAEGKVAVRSEREEAESSVTLQERQMASLSKTDRSVVRRNVDPAPYMAWTKGKLVFRDASFDEVIHRLKSWYGLRVKLVGSVDQVDRLNAAFDEESIGEVLGIVAETLDLRCKREEDAVTCFVEE